MNQEIEVKIPSGLHTRPAGRLVALVKEHDVVCFLHHQENRVNATSILDLVMLMVSYGDRIDLEVHGEKSDIFLQKATQLLNNVL